MKVINYKRGAHLLLIVFLTGVSLFDVSGQTDSTFIPYGKPRVLIFTDLNSTFNSEGNNKAFELTRAYLGYEYFFSRNLYSRLTLDVADPKIGELQMTALVKFAYLQYSKNNFSAKFGMIATDQFSVQEEQWGYRYIFKSFQDAYRLGFSADLGAGIKYSPLKILSFDISVLNGEGYKNLQIDSVFKTTFGLTLKPIGGLVLRGYFDRMKNNIAQTTLSFYAGYSLKNLRTGIEYNMQKNSDLIEENDFSGVSVYASYLLTDKFSVFARYDNLWSPVTPEVSDPLNKNRYGNLFVAGFDYIPVKGVKIAPTYLGYLPYDESYPFTSRVGLYFEIRF